MERRKFLISGAGAGGALAVAIPTASVAQTTLAPPDRITSRMADLKPNNKSEAASNRLKLQTLINSGASGSNLATVELIANSGTDIFYIDGAIVLGDPVIFPSGGTVPRVTEVVSNGRFAFQLCSTKKDEPIFKVVGNNCSIRGVYLSYDTVGSPFTYNANPDMIANAIYLKNVQTFDASRLWIGNCYNGIYIGGGGNHSFVDIRCYSYDNCAFLASACVGVNLTSFLFNAGDSIKGKIGGIRLQGGVEGFTASQGSVQLGLYGLTTADVGSNVRGWSPFYNRFSDVYFDSSLNSVALLQSLHHTDFTSCWFASAGHNHASSTYVTGYVAGIDMSGCTHLRFQGGDVYGNGGMGALVGSTSRFISFGGGLTFKNNQLASPPGGGAAIVIKENTLDCNVMGVQFESDTRQTYAVEVRLGANRYRIVNNSLGGSNSPSGITQGVFDQPAANGQMKLIFGNF
jgi:hypothetical protein